MHSQSEAVINKTMDDSNSVPEEEGAASDHITSKDHQLASSESEGDIEQPFNEGRWSDEEHEKFVKGLEIFGWKNYQQISEYIGTRTVLQVRSHLQKYKQKLEKTSQTSKNAIDVKDVEESSRTKKVKRSVMTSASLKKFVTKKPKISTHQHMQFSEEDDEEDDNDNDNDASQREAAESMAQMLTNAAASSSMPKSQLISRSIISRKTPKAPPAAKSPQNSEPETYVYHDYAQDVPPTFRIPLSEKDSFPLKLHNVLERAAKEGFMSIISWRTHGRAFTIHDEDRMVQLLTKEGLASNWKGFLRSLRAYGFRKITGIGKDMGCFFHEKFLRGRNFLAGTMVPVGQDKKGPAEIPDFSTLPSVEPLKDPTSDDSISTDRLALLQQHVQQQQLLQHQQQLHQQQVHQQHLSHAFAAAAALRSLPNAPNPWYDPAFVGRLVQANIDNSVPTKSEATPQSSRKGTGNEDNGPESKKKEPDIKTMEPEVVVLDDSDVEDEDDKSEQSFGADDEECPLPRSEQSIVTKLFFSLGSASQETVEGSLKRLTSMSIFDVSKPDVGRSLVNKGCVQAILRAFKNFPDDEDIAFYCMTLFTKLADLQIFKFVIILTALDGGTAILESMKKHPKQRAIIIRSLDLLSYLICSSQDAAGPIACGKGIATVVKIMNSYGSDGVVQGKGCLLLGKIGKMKPKYAKEIVPVLANIYESFSEEIGEASRKALLEVLTAADPTSNDGATLTEESSHKKSLRYLFFDLASTDASAVEESITALRRVVMFGATADDLAVEGSSSAQFIIHSLMNHTDTNLSIRSILVMLLDVITLEKNASFYTDVVDIDIARVVLDQLANYDTVSLHNGLEFAIGAICVSHAYLYFHRVISKKRMKCK